MLYVVKRNYELAGLYIINIKIRLTIKKAQVLTAINAHININMTLLVPNMSNDI